MESIFVKLIKRRLLVVIAFVIMSIISIFFARQVGVNNNLVDYLPSSSPSTIAIDVMDAEFLEEASENVATNPNVRKTANSYILVEEITIEEGLAIKSQVAQVEGVISVKWIDDAKSHYPIEMLTEETSDLYYKDSAGLFTVKTYKDEAVAIMNKVKALVDQQTYVYGSGSERVSTNSELMLAMLFILPISLIVILLTTRSYVEPILFLGTIGIAILINNGTNIIFGEISFVTNSAASILQLAVSMDYSIFLLHMFAEFREAGLEPKEAMVEALKKSFSSITASAVTTIIGFAALILMTFTIGKDMGLVMAKGIVISIISVLTLLPALTILFYGLIDKTHHKSFVPSFKEFGKKVLLLRLPITIFAVLFILISFLAVQNNTFFYGMNDNELSQREAVFGKSNEMVLMVPSGDLIKEKAVSDEIQALTEVLEVTSYVDSVGAVIPIDFLDEKDLSQLISANYSRLIITANMQSEGQETFSVINQIKKIVENYYGVDYHLAGDSVSDRILHLDQSRDSLFYGQASFLYCLFNY